MIKMNFFYKIYDALCVDIFEYIFQWRRTNIPATDSSAPIYISQWRSTNIPATASSAPIYISQWRRTNIPATASSAPIYISQWRSTNIPATDSSAPIYISQWRRTNIPATASSGPFSLSSSSSRYSSSDMLSMSSRLSTETVWRRSLLGLNWLKYHITSQ